MHLAERADFVKLGIALEECVRSALKAAGDFL